MSAAMHVLIIEDDADFAESMAILLELEGHRVRTAPDGDAGLELVGRHAFDLVFLDIGLPGKSGFDSLADIRDSRPGTRVVLMSGFSTELLAEKLAEHATDDRVLAVLSKPFEMEQMRAVLESASGAAANPPAGA